MSKQIVTRIAPTPSGYLHLGNAINFVITWLICKQLDGRLLLRIDDADRHRCRAEYVDDIFYQLDWLGIEWDEGPQGSEDFFSNHSQQKKFAFYREQLLPLQEQGLVYRCSCSRKTIKQHSYSGSYPGLCRKNLVFAQDSIPTGMPLRFRLPEEQLVGFPGKPPYLSCPARETGDVVLWRRDAIPAYQLTSLTDDLLSGVNLIIRGQDLASSSAIQLLLAQFYHEPGAGFIASSFYHHPLITKKDGSKLSKSDQDLSLKEMRLAGLSQASVYQKALETLFTTLPYPIFPNQIEEINLAVTTNPKLAQYVQMLPSKAIWPSK